VEEGRSIGLDVGEARIGVAVTDPLGMMSHPHGIIEEPTLNQSVQGVLALIDELAPVRIVVGMPLDMNGQPGLQAGKVAKFVDALQAALDTQADAPEIVTQDERYSTSAAERAIAGGRLHGKKRKHAVDKIAAHHILQTYMDRLKHKRDRASQ